MSTLPDPHTLTFDVLIPADAQEVVTRTDDDGVKQASVFSLGGQRLASVVWGEDGVLGSFTTARWRIELHDNGMPRYAAPLVDGKIHGQTVQWTPQGEPLSVCTFKHGTGVDYWCDHETGALAEEHPQVDGRPHGIERWWSEDENGPSVFHERHWYHGMVHGIERWWVDESEAPDAGYPKFFIQNETVDRESYLRAARDDSTLPPWRAADDRPHRALPTGFARLIVRPRAWDGED
ncbi:MAG: hypothetical protein AAFV53_07590 [Myxococcota bacterium]